MDIFKKLFIFVPINESLHWYLAVVYNPGALLIPEPEILEIDETDEQLTEIDAPMEALEEMISIIPAIDEPLDVEMASADEESEVMLTPEEFEQLENENQAYASTSIVIEEYSDESLSSSGSNELQSTNLQKAPSTPEVQEIPKKERPKPLKAPPIKETIAASFTKKQKKEEKAAKKAQKKYEENKEKFVYCLILRCSIVVMDSLGVGRRRPTDALKAYLTSEALTRFNINVNPKKFNVLSKARVPLQPNHCDCGVYVIKSMEYILTQQEDFIDYILVRSNRFNS